MNVRILKKIQLDFKCNSSIFVKHPRSIHYISNASLLNVYKNHFLNSKVLMGYFSNKRNFSNTQNAVLHQQLHPKVFQRSLLCNKDIVLISKIPSNCYPTAVNSVRQYSNSGFEVVNETIKYNGGIFQMISESICVEWVTEAFRYMHYQTGLPWWASIILTTIITRTFINLPLNILDLHNRAKQENLKDEMMDIAEKVKRKVDREVVLSQLSPVRAIALYTREMSNEQKRLYVRDNCHPFKSVAMVLLQAPIWISFSVAVRNMCYVLPQISPATVKDFQELTTGGFGWIQNLVDIDHFFILPILFGFSHLVTMEVNYVLFKIKDSRFNRIYKNFCRVLIVCFMPIMACLPSCLSLFWITNNCYGLLQNLVLLSPKVRKLLRIPKTDSDLRHPYQKLHERLLGKFSLTKSVAKA
ncbi:cytochrome c oxidase assembly protein COX18, mitochondrial [Bombus flavifrons]|uniref:cytochrome c oxidase assembly protein COX18, mitochondrial n=1 Tax=Bombus flavifrons TaxID=103934 RepID=UPI0037041BB4